MGRLLRPALLAASALLLAGALTLLAAVALGGVDGGTSDRTDGAATRPQPGTAAQTAVLSPGSRDIAGLQQRLRRTPGDHRAWSTLASAYVEQARVTADPTYFAKADRAIRRAEALAPRDSVLATARAALDNARHDFAAALRHADAALVVNPYSAAAHALRADALTELGRYAEARRAALRADALEPGPGTFARLSYAAELRGDLDQAARLMTMSRDAAGASAPAYSFASFHLGELARTVGDLDTAAGHYAAALEADPSYAPALAGQARLAVAAGDVDTAVRRYRDVVARLPLPEYVVEFGELLESLGRDEEAAQQYAVARAAARLARANGVRTDLETALFEADHGSAEAALAAARAEWRARRSVHAADALGWALHVTGRSAEALRYAQAATRLGTLDARFLWHRGEMEAALGRTGAARRHLQAALDLDAGVAPWREQRIRATLAGLGGAR